MRTQADQIDRCLFRITQAQALHAWRYRRGRDQNPAKNGYSGHDTFCPLKWCMPRPISHKILKNLAAILAPPVTSIINSSMRQGVVPDQWKLARVTPIPKIYPVLQVFKY